jgi:hypothetical protein
MIGIATEISANSEILYQTPDENPESGSVTRCAVVPPRGETTTLDTFQGKFILVAQRPEFREGAGVQVDSSSGWLICAADSREKLFRVAKSWTTPVPPRV